MNINSLKQIALCLYLMLAITSLNAQNNYHPCAFDSYTNNKSIQKTESIIQKGVIKLKNTSLNKASHDSTKTIPVVVHVLHIGGSENISELQIQSQITIMNEDYGKITGTNGDGNGVDTKVRFCLAQIDPIGNCTNGIVRVFTSLTNHKTYERAMLKQLSFWDNTKYMNIYIVKSITGGVLGYSSFPGGPPDEDGMVMRYNVFGNTGTASSSLGRTASHEIGHWFGLYHTFNNGCGTDLCTDGDYVCDTPPQASPSFNCSTINSCSNDIPNVNDQKENYMNYTPDVCKSMFTNGQKLRIQSTLDNIRTTIWSQINLIATGCDSNYLPPASCLVIADFVTLTPEICVGNSINFIDKSLNEATSWQWTFDGGIPTTSTNQNPTVVYNTNGNYDVKLVVSDGVTFDSVLIQNHVIVSPSGIGEALSFGQNFDDGLYPPTGITINNYDAGITWELDSLASTTGDYSIKINNLINTNYGSSDELQFPAFDFTTAHPDSIITMTFKWAYARSDPSFSDEMIVLLSTDCGVNFSQVYYRTGNGLVTGPTQTTPFIPDSTQWKDAFIYLDTYENESNVQIKIVNVTDGGNNLYIDDIYIGDGSQSTTSVNEIVNSFENVTLFPNPTKSGSTLQYSINQAVDVTISIYDINGRLIKSFKEVNKGGYSEFFIPTGDIQNGIYLIKINSEQIEKTIRLIVGN